MPSVTDPFAKMFLLDVAKVGFASALILHALNWAFVSLSMPHWARRSLLLLRCGGLIGCSRNSRCNRSD